MELFSHSSNKYFQYLLSMIYIKMMLDKNVYNFDNSEYLI